MAKAGRAKNWDVAPTMFANKKATRTQVVEWVAENLTNEAVRPDDAPSAIAWALLHDAREDGDFRRRCFWSQIWAKYHLADKLIEMFEDDGGSLKIVERLRKEAKERGVQPEEPEATEEKTEW